MVTVSVIMYVYNAEQYIAQAIASVLQQSYEDFELLLIDDQSSDNSVDIAENFTDPRIRIVHLQNMGLAAGRNTGIHLAQGKYIALINAGDYWAVDKLEKHIAHLEDNPHLGLSYCPSKTVDSEGRVMGIRHVPKLNNIGIEDILCSNPIDNGSVPVIRKAAFEAVAFKHHRNGEVRYWYFDETFKQSEDIECWLRIATQTPWQFAGIPQALTFCRSNEDLLSLTVVSQFDSWKRAVKKLQVKSPKVFATWGRLAEAYQLRSLARRAIRSREAKLAMKLVVLAIKTDARILWKDPKRTLLTLACAGLVKVVPKRQFSRMEAVVMGLMDALGSATLKIHAG
ncbi:hypothetical protein JCM14076_15460 [Methylosoma difficile]